jgi:hypothetical protein
MTNDFKRVSLAAALLLLLPAAGWPYAPASPARAAEKMKPEEVIAKHLEAVGPEETRKSVKSRIAQGTANVTFRAPTIGQAAGRLVMASEGDRHMLAMAFDTAGYSQEKIGFDGDKATVGYIKPGQRSSLGDFLMTHKNIISQGLLGGALSQAWPLFDTAGMKAKLEYAGTKKIGDRQAHELKYTPRGGTDVRISLFFDAETFQHVRTEYFRVIEGQMSANPEATRQGESRYRMVEEFSDFKKEGGLTLPHSYNIKLDLDASRGTSLRAEWQFKLSQFAYNQPIDPGSFNMGTE